jgi:hypothetical protein
MFTLIRAVVIIGLIFYLSPERGLDRPERPARDGDRLTALTAGPRTSEAGDTSESLWDRLVGNFGQEVVQAAVNNKAEAIGDQVFGPSGESSAKSAMADSLRLDRELTDGTSPGQSVRCIYRCDGAE